MGRSPSSLCTATCEIEDIARSNPYCPYQAIHGALADVALEAPLEKWCHQRGAHNCGVNGRTTIGGCLMVGPPSSPYTVAAPLPDVCTAVAAANQKGSMKMSHAKRGLKRASRPRSQGTRFSKGTESCLASSSLRDCEKNKDTRSCHFLVDSSSNVPCLSRCWPRHCGKAYPTSAAVHTVKSYLPHFRRPLFQPEKYGLKRLFM